MIQAELLKAAGVEARDIARLEEAWAAYRNAADRPVRQVPRIVCTGIYNAGKSTLLNALCGQEKFPTGDVPTTKKVAQAEFGGAVYIDTPGLNAEDADDRETLAAYDTADFILFVANAQNGGISEAEAGWLKRLEERYTAGSLSRRLVYVLTHCAQVEPEELAGIETRVRENLEKVLGFVPERIFSVDSVSYQQGRREGENLLAERSGIPEFQAYFAKRIAGAGETLRQTQADEAEARRRELLEQMGTIGMELQEEYSFRDRQVQTKISEIDAVWEQFEATLAKAMPLGDIKPISCFISFQAPSIHVKERSEYAARKKLEERVKPVYEKRERVVSEAVRKAMDYVRKRYCFSGLDSAYVICCNKITQEMNKCVLSFQKMGVPVSGAIEISVKPELPPDLSSEIERELMDDAVPYGEYYTLSKYVEMYGDIDCYSEYEKGLFGIEREVDMYHVYSTFHIVGEIEKDIKSNLDSNIRYANDILNRHWQTFLKKVVLEVNNRKATLKSQVDACRNTLKQESDTAEIEAAISHLDTLTKGVSQ